VNESVKRERTKIRDRREKGAVIEEAIEEHHHSEGSGITL